MNRPGHRRPNLPDNSSSRARNLKTRPAADWKRIPGRRDEYDYDLNFFFEWGAVRPNSYPSLPLDSPSLVQGRQEKRERREGGFGEIQKVPLSPSLSLSLFVSLSLSLCLSLSWSGLVRYYDGERKEG